MSSWMTKMVACLAVVGLVSAVSFAEGDKPKPAGDKPKVMESVELPPAVANAIKAEFPTGTVAGSRLNEKTKVYTVTVNLGEKKTARAMVTEAGVIESVTTPVAAADLPKAVADAVKNGAPDGTVKGAQKVEQRADKEGKKLAPAKVTYEVALSKEGAMGQIGVAEDGTVVRPVAWKELGAKKEGGEKKEGAKKEGEKKH